MVRAVVRATLLRSSVHRIAAFLCLLLWGSFASAQQSGPEELPGPYLRIETSEHTASVNRIATNGTGDLIATVSDDKTVRLWATDGRPIGVLRIPIGPEDQGQLHALALSQDGRRLAAAGITGDIAAGNFAIFLFDVEQQRLIGRLGGYPAPIRDLAFSRDGTRLAVAVAGKGGVRVLNLTENRREYEDFAYGGRVESVSFGPRGELASASLDGFVRVYDKSGKMIAKRQPFAQGGRPTSVAFSPDGGFLAVAFDDKVRVLLLASSDLSQRWQPDTKTLTTGALSRVAWTSIGRSVHLIAAGTVQNASAGVIVRRWNDFGFGPPEDLVVANDAVNHLEPSPSGGYLYASADPGWGRISTTGAVVARRRGLTGDFRDIFDGRFGVSANGLSIEFGMAQGGKRPVRFDVAERRLMTNPPADPSIKSPAWAATPKLRTNAWRNSFKPTLANKPLALEKDENSRSLALSADEAFFVLGADQFIRTFNAQGVERARVAIPATAWGVALTEAGDRIVAALGDGTIRWYERPTGDGKELRELVALFVHSDGQRWVAWTPEGFFDHSDDGGKDLVGYQFNRGRARKPDYVSFAQLYRVFYAPDLVAQRFAGRGAAELKARLAEIGDLRTVLERARPPEIVLEEVCWNGAEGVKNCYRIPQASTSRGLTRIDRPPAEISPAVGAAAETPAVQAPSPVTTASAPLSGGMHPAPLVAVMETPAGVDRVRLRYQIIDQGGGIGSVNMFVNERNVGRVDAARGLQRLNASGSSPAPATGGAGASISPPGPIVEEREILLDAGKNNIELRAYDSHESLYSTSQILELITPEDTSAKPELYVVAAGIDAYKGAITPLNFALADAKSVADVLRSGGGGVFARSHVTLLSDAEASTANIEAKLSDVARRAKPIDTVIIYLAGHGVLSQAGYVFVTPDVTSADEASLKKGFSEQRILAIWSQIRAKNSMLFLDTCQAGGFSLDFAGKMSHESGRYVLAAAASVEAALDSYNGRNGVFAHAVLQGLGKDARRDSDGDVSNFELGWYVRDTVPRLAREKNHVQRAAFRGRSEELLPFPIARLRPATEIKTEARP